MAFRVITKKRLQAYARRYPEAAEALQVWLAGIGSTEAHNLAALRQRFPSADLVGRLTIFNIAGNRYRLIARVEYQRQEVYIRAFLTHAEYISTGWPGFSNCRTIFFIRCKMAHRQRLRSAPLNQRCRNSFASLQYCGCSQA